MLVNVVIILLILIDTVFTCNLSWLAITVGSVITSCAIQVTLRSVCKRLLISTIKDMTFMEFFHLYNPRVMQTGHRIYDHAQVLLSLAKWVDIKTEQWNNFFDRCDSLLKSPEGNSSIMDVILAMTYLLACKKHPTVEEVTALIGKFTTHHDNAYSLYTELIDQCTGLNIVLTVNDTGKDWHLDDAIALFVLFNVLMLSKPSSNLHLYIVGAGKDPITVTHNHKVLATGILGSEIDRVHFINSPGAANEAKTGVQHVVKFEVEDRKLPQTHILVDLHNIQNTDIVAFCAETSCSVELISMNATVAGIQGGFGKSETGAYVGFNALQSHEATSLLEQWTRTNVEHAVNATKVYAQNLSQQGTEIFNNLLQVAGVVAVDMQLSSLLNCDPIRYAGITSAFPGLLKGDHLYDRMTPLLAQMGILHNPQVWVTSIPDVKNRLTDPTNINWSAAVHGRTIQRKASLFLYIGIVKAAFYL